VGFGGGGVVRLRTRGSRDCVATKG
jgi:hypothetical protein